VVLGGDRGGLTDEVRAKGRRRGLKVRLARAAKRAADLLPLIESIRKAGAISLQDIADGLNQRGIPATRGGMW